MTTTTTDNYEIVIPTVNLFACSAGHLSGLLHALSYVYDLHKNAGTNVEMWEIEIILNRFNKVKSAEEDAIKRRAAEI
jgi:hypothetical protein